MDAFKPQELALMAAGGNKPWQTFFDNHQTNKLEGRTFEDSTIAERYEGEVGEEYKERLAAKADGREYVPEPAEAKERRRAEADKRKKQFAGVAAGSNSGSRSGSPAPGVPNPLSRTQSGLSNKPSSRSASPALGTAAASSAAARRQNNEAFFARMGAENAARPADLPPSQGGKFAGFGSDWPAKEAAPPGGAAALPSADDFQQDPMKALTKGFGWLSTTVGKAGQEGLKRVRIAHPRSPPKHPLTRPQLQEADLASQAQRAAAGLHSAAQTTWAASSRGATDAFSRFVEGADTPRTGPDSAHLAYGADADAYAGDPDRKAFWDGFAAAGEARAAEKARRPRAPPEPDRKDFWDEFASIGEARARAQGAGAAPGVGGAAAKAKSSVGTAAMARKGAAGPAARADEWEDW